MSVMAMSSLRPTRSRKLLAMVLVAAVVAALATVGLTGVFSSADASRRSPTVSGPSDAPFRIAYPKTWHALRSSETAVLPGSPLAVLRRNDGRGTIVIQRRPPLRSTAPALARGLKRELALRYSDFREIGAKVVTLHGSRALVYTFARTRTGTAQSSAIVPAGGLSYGVNAVVPPRSADAAREVGAIIASFDARAAR
jgi:hypothetical protein